MRVTGECFHRAGVFGVYRRTVCPRRALVRQERGFNRGGYQSFQVAPSVLRVGVFGGDDFALFSQPNLPRDGAGRLCEHRLISWPAAAPDAAAAPVKEPQAHAARRENFAQANFCAIQAPGRSEVAAIFVAVRIAQHNLLRGRGGLLLEQGFDKRQIEPLRHDGRRGFKIADGFKERNHVHRQVLGRHQARFFEEQQHFKQVRHRLAMGDDVIRCCRCTKALVHGCRHVDDGELTLGFWRIAGAVNREQARLHQLLQKQGLARLFRQCRVIFFDFCNAQQLGNGTQMALRVLPQINRCQVKTKHLHRTQQRAHLEGDYAACAVAFE